MGLGGALGAPACKINLKKGKKPFKLISNKELSQWKVSLNRKGENKTVTLNSGLPVPTKRNTTQSKMQKVLTAGLNLGGGVRSFLASQERFLTTLLWMAQLTQ